MRPVRYTAIAADVANGFTPPVPVDYLAPNVRISVQYLNAAGGAGTGTVQQTVDDPFNPPATVGLTWTPTTMVGNQGLIEASIGAVRVLNPGLGDVLLVREQGMA